MKLACGCGLTLVPSATVVSSMAILAGVPSSFWMIPGPARWPHPQNMLGKRVRYRGMRLSGVCASSVLRSVFVVVSLNRFAAM